MPLFFILLLIFSTAVTGALFVSAICFTGAADTSTFAERITVIRRPAANAAAALLLFPAAFFLLIKAFSRFLGEPFPGAGEQAQTSPVPAQIRPRRLNILILLTGLCALASGLFWIRTNPFPPIADQYVLWDSAVLLSKGEPLAEYADYLRCYPYQKGMILFFSLGVRLFGPHPLRFIRPLNVLCFCLILCLLARIACRLFRSGAAAVLTGLSGLVFAPLLLYTSYVYATLLTLTLILFSFDMLLILTETKKTMPALLLLCSSSLACVLYSSAWIAVIAEAMYLLYIFLKKHPSDKPRPSGRYVCVLLILLFLLPVLLGRGTQKLFSSLTGIEETAGTPAAAFLVMGLSSENGANGPGSHNGYDIALYSENGLDDEKTAKAANAALREVIREYLDGERTLSFFGEKTLYQWSDPWFGSASLTLHPTTVPVTASPRFEKIMNSHFFDGLQIFLAAFQLFVYAAVLLFLTVGITGKSPLPDGTVLLLLYFCGGFVFQLFWESKSRYCLPYFVILLPFAVNGVRMAAQAAARRLSAR